MKKFFEKFNTTEQEREDLLEKLNSQVETNATKNLEWLNSVMNESLTERLIKIQPGILLLDINEKNPASLKSKFDFYAQYGIKPYELFFLSKIQPQFLLKDIYEDEKVFQTIKFFVSKGFTKKEVGKLIKRYPRIFSAKNIKPNYDFWQEKMNIIGKDAKLMILKKPSLLDCSLNPADRNEVVYKLRFFQKFFKLTQEELLKQIYRNPLILGFSIERESMFSIFNKLKPLNEIGLTNENISHDLSILCAPSKKIKIRYIICKNFGMKDSVFTSNKYKISEAKLYARASFLSQRRFPKSLIYATEGDFWSRTKISDLEIAQQFVLTEEKIKNQEAIFNRNYPNKTINLTQEEILAIRRDK